MSGNKLYCLKFYIKGECFFVKNFWNESEAQNFISGLGGSWKADVVTDNFIHKIWRCTL